MRQCILHVTDHEFDQILQWNHDDLAWSNQDRPLFQKLAVLLGNDVAEQLSHFDECRMQKHFDLTGIPRIEAEAADLVSH